MQAATLHHSPSAPDTGCPELKPLIKHGPEDHEERPSAGVKDNTVVIHGTQNSDGDPLLPCSILILLDSGEPILH